MTTNPGDLVVGVGSRAGSTAAAVLAAIAEVVGDTARVRALATLDRRTTDPAITDAAGRLGVEVIGFTAAELAAVAVPSPSGRVAARVGTPSVAEAAALLASGGELVVRKLARHGVTVALARTV